MAKYTQKKIAAKLAARAATDADEISPEQEGELKALGEGILSLGRRTTEQALELGGYLARAKSILPERAFSAWVKAICKFTPKTARNYIAVHEHLSEYKDRLVTAAVAPTILFVLAYAEQPDVERVISALEAGEQLTVAQVKTMVGAMPAKKVTNEAVLDVGGMAGLRKIAELKVEEDSVKFLQLTTGILKRVEKAMEPLAQNRAVFKGPLQELIIADCKHAHDLINSIAAPLQPAMVASVNWRPARLTEGTTWARCRSFCPPWVEPTAGRARKISFPGFRPRSFPCFASSSTAMPCKATLTGRIVRMPPLRSTRRLTMGCSHSKTCPPRYRQPSRMPWRTCHPSAGTRPGARSVSIPSP
ncbi:hypothetical protein DXM26_18495 [Agrobacterium tumefaciens]|uniref:hypothetical protein n=1 Tax=Agrobacterium tumefaciens TaxID=358 RepID=UPI00122FE8B0|nr:hypothetical protein DXM26_18495 [Agrobacterium tumefaciens]